MKKLFTALLLAIVIGVVAGIVASMMARKRLEAMTDDEIREYLAGKLDGKVDEDQLASIQKAAITGIRKGARAVAAEMSEAANADDSSDDVAPAEASAADDSSDDVAPAEASTETDVETEDAVESEDASTV